MNALLRSIFRMIQEDQEEPGYITQKTEDEIARLIRNWAKKPKKKIKKRK